MFFVTVLHLALMFVMTFYMLEPLVNSFFTWEPTKPAIANLILGNSKNSVVTSLLRPAGAPTFASVC